MTHILCLSVPLSEYFICKTAKRILLDFKLLPRKKKRSLFWDVTRRGLEMSYRHFGNMLPIHAA
jgi:hypothetical protein